MSMGNLLHLQQVGGHHVSQPVRGDCDGFAVVLDEDHAVQEETHARVQVHIGQRATAVLEQGL